MKTKAGLKKVDIKEGFRADLDTLDCVIVMTACDDDEVSFEFPWFQNGVFTYYIDMALDGLADDSELCHGCDIDYCGIGNDSLKISTDELFYATWCLDYLLGYGWFGYQTPQYNADGSWVRLFKMEYCF